MSKIKTFEAACKVKGLDAKKILPDVSTFPEEHQKALIAHAKLILIAEVLNDGWKPNWEDDDEYKYYPWFYMDKTRYSSGFSFAGVLYVYSSSLVGSRLCFKSRDIAEYAGKTFVKLYKDLFVL
jgi:hypothetical protein